MPLDDSTVGKHGKSVDQGVAADIMSMTPTPGNSSFVTPGKKNTENPEKYLETSEDVTKKNQKSRNPEPRNPEHPGRT